MTYRFFMGLLALLFVSTAQAENFSYRFINIVKTNVEYDFGSGQKIDADLIGTSGSMPINKMVFVTGGYVEGDFEGNIDAEGWHIGLGAHFPLNQTTDFVIDFSHAEAKASRGSQSSTADGEGLALGIRAEFNPKLELFAQYSADLDDSDDSVEIGGLIKLTPTVALGLSFANGDDYDATSIALRMYFD